MTNEQKLIRPKLGLLELANHLGNVSQACKVMGYSRDSFYRFKKLYDRGGALALQELTRRKPNLRNRIAPEIESAVLALSLKQPAWGQTRIANELRKRALSISPAGVRCVWRRHELENMKLRLKALGAKVAQEGAVLTEAQLQALEKKREDEQAHGEFGSEPPGVLRCAGHVLRGALEGRGAHLPANVCRHVLEGGAGEALRHEDPADGSRSAQ